MLGGDDLYQLDCFKQNNNFIYSWVSSTFACFPPTLSVQEINSSFTLLMSPNPFSSQTTLKTNTLLNNATLAVYNCFGQQVKLLKNISGKEIILQRDNLPGGLYFIRLIEGGKILGTEKLVITD